MMTEVIFPIALKATKKLSALGALPLPKTALKKREAASSFEALSSFSGTKIED